MGKLTYLFSAALAFSVVSWNGCLLPVVEEELGNVLERIGSEQLGGAAVDAGRLSVGIGMRTKACLNRLTISNVGEWESLHLLKLKRISVTADVGKILRSLKRKPLEVELNEILIEGLHLTLEKSLWTSNVRTLLRAINEKRRRREESMGPRELERESKKRKRKPQRKKGDPEDVAVRIGRVRITGVTVELTTSANVRNGLRGGVVKLADIIFEDFTKQFGVKSIDVVAEILVKTVLESVLANAAYVAKLGVRGAVKGARYVEKSSIDYVKEEIWKGVRNVRTVWEVSKMAANTSASASSRLLRGGSSTLLGLFGSSSSDER